MKKEFKFSLKKETVIELTNAQKSTVIGGAAFQTENQSVCDCDNPETFDTMCGPGCYKPTDSPCGPSYLSRCTIDIC